jgi:hypothetical protein
MKRKIQIKGIPVIVLAFVVLVGLNTWPQGSTTPKGDKKAAKIMTFRGTVSTDAKTFVDDKDKKSWTVVNPEALKGHEGHHVSIRAQVDADKNEVHVRSVKMLAEAKAKGKKKSS